MPVLNRLRTCSHLRSLFATPSRERLYRLTTSSFVDNTNDCLSFSLKPTCFILPFSIENLLNRSDSTWRRSFVLDNRFSRRSCGHMKGKIFYQAKLGLTLLSLHNQRVKMFIVGCKKCLWASDTHPAPLLHTLPPPPLGRLRWGKHPCHVGLPLSKGKLVTQWKPVYQPALKVHMKFPLLTYCFVSVQKGSSTYVQGSGRWYSLLWVVSTATPSTSTP